MKNYSIFVAKINDQILTLDENNQRFGISTKDKGCIDYRN